MPKELISLKAPELINKINNIRTVKSTIENDIIIKKLTFGANSAKNASKGIAVNKIKELNVELEIIIAKLATLNEKTTENLEGILKTFESADNTTVTEG